MPPGSHARDRLLHPPQKTQSMEMGTFGILILSGLCNLALSSIYNREYHFVKDAKTWLDAQQYCRMKYKDLAPVNNEQDLGKLSGVVTGRDKVIFVGLHRNWSWSLSDTDDYKVGEEAYWNWASDQPTINDCGTIDGLTGEWSAIDCSTKLNFTCYNTDTTNNPQRFTLIKTPMMWHKAQAHCRKYYTDMARVRDKLENDQVQMMVKNGSVWIGLTRKSWMWSDGSENLFIPWKPQQPQAYGIADCSALVISNPLALADVACSGVRPFLCYSEPVKKRLMRLRLSVNEVNMADPAVLDSVMNWVRTKMGDAGATTQLKLTWWKRPKLEIREEKKTEAPQKDTLCLR